MRVTSLLFVFLAAGGGCSGGGGGNGGSGDAAGEARQWGPSTIGPEGGIVDLPGGGTIDIPAGALAEPTEITPTGIDAPEGEAFTPVGPFHSLAPDGLELAQPAWLAIPYSLDDVEGDESTLAMVWASPDGTWEFLSGAQVDPDEKKVRAPVTKLSKGGPVWLPATSAVCCVQVGADGYETSIVLEGQCQDGEGTFSFGDLAACESVCCAWNDGTGNVSEVIPAGICDNVSGSAGPPDGCKEVCCIVDDGISHPWAKLMPGSECSHQDDSFSEPAAADPAKCEAVCCNFSSGLTEGTSSFLLMPAGVCELANLAAYPLDACKEVCCLVKGKAGSAAVVISQTDCEAGENNTVYDSAACQEVCCDLPTLEEGEAPEEGDGPVSAAGFSMAGAECLALGGAVGPAADCLKTCCVFPDGADVPAAIVPQADCDAQGGISAGDEVECAPMCCRLDPIPGLGEYVSIPKTLCDKEGGSIYDAEDCVRVCCTDEEAPVETMAATECYSVGGAPTDVALCPNVCCDPAGAGPDAVGLGAMAVTEEQCNKLGSVVDDAQCAGVCCLLAGTQTAELTVGGCAAAGGTTVGDLAACKESCCTVTQEGPNAGDSLLLPAGLCQLLGAAVAEDEHQCDAKCCTVGGGGFARSDGGCADVGGTAGPPGGCEEGCCTFTDAVMIREAPSIKMQRDACEKIGAYSPFGCSEECCLLGPNGGAALVSDAECAYFGSTLAQDASQCQPVCCQTADKRFTATFFNCTAAGGTPVALEKCQSAAP